MGLLVERNEKKNSKLRLKVLLGGLALVLVGTGVYWTVQSKNEPSKTEEVKKDTNNAPNTTTPNKTEQAAPSNKKQEQTPSQQTPNQQTPNQQTPKQEQSPDASIEGPGSDVWETKAKLLQGDVATVTKDTEVNLFAYFEVENSKPGVRDCLIDFSNPAAVEVIHDTPNGTPTIVKFKSDVTMTVVTGKNKVNVQFKVK